METATMISSSVKPKSDCKFRVRRCKLLVALFFILISGSIYNLTPDAMQMNPASSGMNNQG